MADFVTESTVRRSLGDVYAGERVTHAVMGILYGAMLAMLLPVLAAWWRERRRCCSRRPPSQRALRWALTVMAVGVFVSGVRDLYAAAQLPYGDWPWSADRAATPRPARGLRS